MERYLQIQNERLRNVLWEETRQQAVMLQRYETELMSLMQQKDEEIANATRKSMELHEGFIKAETKAKEWKNKALKKEDVVINLNKKLSQMKEFNGAQNAESSMCELEEREGKSKKMGCKLCHVRSSCVVFLPCRHLCCCECCDVLFGFCPVCGSVKRASMEVFFV